jgi:23S rRNA (cytosine1962-C5)-methyltransferase
MYKKIFLKSGEENRLLKGDFWVYDNEILSDLKDVKKGEIVHIHSEEDNFIAVAYANPVSKITLRVLSRNSEDIINRDFIKKRIKQSDHFRTTLKPENRYYRMIYAEADFLPGLVIDRFDRYFIVQITTAGMENFKDDIFSIIEELYPGAVIVEKSISTVRLKEGLEEINRVFNPNKKSETIIQINGLRFKVDFLISQKTGFFLDQRENYLMLKNISKDQEVLDVFSYAGAWGLHAYQYGAKQIDFIEISHDFLKLARDNVQLNGFDVGDFNFTRADAVKILKEKSKAGEKRDIIILDPPAFVKSRKRLKDAIRGYKEINLRAFKMIKAGGFIVTCSCSHFLQKEDFIKMIIDASVDAKRRIKIVDFKSQPYDHSILLPLFQSEYLKCALIYVY